MLVPLIKMTLAADDSFDTLPSYLRKRRKKVVTNSTKLKKKYIPPPAKAMRRATNRSPSPSSLSADPTGWNTMYPIKE